MRPSCKPIRRYVMADTLISSYQLTSNCSELILNAGPKIERIFTKSMKSLDKGPWCSVEPVVDNELNTQQTDRYCKQTTMSTAVCICYSLQNDSMSVCKQKDLLVNWQWWLARMNSLLNYWTTAEQYIYLYILRHI